MARTGRTAGGAGGYVVDTIGPHLDVILATVENRVQDRMSRGAEEIEHTAQQNAPWSDRTGDARAGLTAEAGVEDGELVISLYHTVDYGMWLELIQDGRFAIILPTLEQLGPEILRSAGEVTLEVPG